MRSHKILDNIQHIFSDIPVLMLYPGTFNGQDLGIAWTPPYAVTAPGLKAKGNVLEISVVNLWANRLIRDAALPPAERLTNTGTSPNPFKKDHALFPSGLYGPVTIRQ